MKDGCCHQTADTRPQGGIAGLTGFIGQLRNVLNSPRPGIQFGYLNPKEKAKSLENIPHAHSRRLWRVAERVFY